MFDKQPQQRPDEPSRQTEDSGTRGEAHPYKPDRQFTTRDIRRLQRMIGNRAVRRLIQRDETTSALLTDAEIQAAIQWYAGQSARYTPDIVHQIQRRVGRPPSTDGQMHEEDVVAVAEWQQDHMLDGGVGRSVQPDGRAGPTTLSQMFPSGLMEGEQQQAFAQQLGGLRGQWGDMSQVERMEAIQNAINERLEANGIPAPLEYRIEAGQDAAGASFWDTYWRMTFYRPLVGQQSGSIFTEPNQLAVDDDNLSVQEMGWLIEMAYHESRHMEQAFNAARVLAGRMQQAGQTPNGAAIRAQMQIPAEIADQAAANPLDPHSMQGVIAQAWFDSRYGSQAEETNDTYRRLSHAGAELTHDTEAHEEHPSPETAEELEGAERRYGRASRPYYALPGEADAYRAGRQTRGRYELSEIDSPDI